MIKDFDTKKDALGECYRLTSERVTFNNTPGAIWTADRSTPTCTYSAVKRVFVSDYQERHDSRGNPLKKARTTRADVLAAFGL